jgi:hypothetical protein
MNLNISILDGNTCIVTVDGQPIRDEHIERAQTLVARLLPHHLPVLVATQEPSTGDEDVWFLQPGRANGPRRLILGAPLDEVHRVPETDAA